MTSKSDHAHQAAILSESLAKQLADRCTVTALLSDHFG